jgi:cold shock CspA family protein
MNGHVVKVLPDKNFGFIKAMGKEFFFHRSDFNGHWEDLVSDFQRQNPQTIKVTFDEAESLKGPRAANVRREDFPNQAV